MVFYKLNSQSVQSFSIMKIFSTIFLLISFWSFCLRAQENNKFAIKLNIGLNRNPVYNAKDLTIYSYKNKFFILPSFMIKNKKNKWREFQIGYNFDKTENDKILNNISGNNLNKQYFNEEVISNVFFECTKYNDILKKKKRKISWFITGNSRIEFDKRKFEYYGYENLYNNGLKLLYFKFGLSNRLAYNFSEQLFMEFKMPFPVLINCKIISGKKTTDAPVGYYFKEQIIFDFDQQIEIKPSKLWKEFEKGGQIGIVYKF